MFYFQKKYVSMIFFMNCYLFYKLGWWDCTIAYSEICVSRQLLFNFLGLCGKFQVCKIKPTLKGIFSQTFSFQVFVIWCSSYTIVFQGQSTHLGREL